MKRIITYLSIFAALLAVSCNRMEPSDFTGESDVVRFALSSSGMETRAIDPNAVDNENVINTVDYFFFKNVKGTTVLVHDSKTFAEDEERILSFDTTKDAYKSLRKPFYAYFLVNYKDAEGNGIDHSKTWTLEQLLNLPIVTNFLPKNEEDDTEEKVAEFVMDSGNEPVYVKAETQGQTVEKKISLYHVAAKIVLNMTVAQSVTGLDDTWTPVMDQVTLRFWNALKKATVKAEPVERTETSKKTDYINYPDEKPTKSGTSYTSRIFYTYPQLFGTKSDEGKVTYKNGEPYFKMTFVWKGAKVGATRFYYKILLPNLEKIERNKYYVLNVNINELGGVEDEYVKVSDHYYVVDWQSPAAITQAGVTESRFLDIALPVYSFYGKDEMNVPVISSHPIEIVIDSATKEVFKEGVDDTVSQDAEYPKTNANTDFTLKHTLVTDVTRDDYDCGIITYKVTVYHADDHSWKKTVIIKQYPPVYVKADKSNGYAYVNSYTYGNTNLANQTGTARGGRWRSYQNGDKISYMAYNNNGDELASMNQGDGLNSNYNQYVVNVSVLPQGYKVAGMSDDVIIGDPRGGELANNYLGYAAGTNGGEVTNVKSEYKPASSTTQNVIAPALRIASSWGATTYLNNFDRAEERCAAYQENGYPAGRWRLPTVAEIDFLIQLSTYEHIPALFTTDSQDIYHSNREATNFTFANTYYSSYWSNGPSVYAGKPYTDNGHTSPYELGGEETSLVAPESQPTYGPWYAEKTNYGYYLWIPYDNQLGYAYIGHDIPLVIANSEYFEPHVRCVYDEWYWGEAPMNNQGNYITKQAGESYEDKYPKNQRATQWLGYKMD